MKIVTKQILTAIKDVHIRMQDLAKAQEQAGDKAGAVETRDCWREQLVNMEIGICSDCDQAYELVPTGDDRWDDLNCCAECLAAAIRNDRADRETRKALNQIF